MAAKTETKTETLSVKITPETLSALQNAAERDGRRVEDVAEDAVTAYVEGRYRNGSSNPNIRPHVMAHFEASMARNSELLEKLAK